MENIVAIFILIFCSVIGGLILWKLFDITRNSIQKNNKADDEHFNRLAQAFMQHKKEMEQRVQNLEAVIAEGETHGRDLTSIEASDGERSLTNDLNNKNKVRS